MTEKELKEKINKINDELNNINEKLKDSTDTAIIKGMYAKDELDDKIKEIIYYKQKYPESSLEELAGIISTETEKKITKSGINHRFRKIKEMIKD